MNELLKRLALLAAALLAPLVLAADPAPKLLPGSSFTLTFADMPPTFHALNQKKTIKAQMTVSLPNNYDARSKHPLFILLEGGDGGTGGSTARSREISEGRDFICVSMPLFKATPLTKSADGTGGFIMTDPDGRYMWPFFKTMLEALDKAVPNIASTSRVLGGSSNGAHATSALLDESDGEVARRFSAFLFVEGGGKLHRYDLLKGKQFLMVSSNAKSKPRALQICDAAKEAGAKAVFVCEDVGKHDFPASSYPAVREWLRRSVSE